VDKQLHCASCIIVTQRKNVEDSVALMVLLHKIIQVWVYLLYKWVWGWVRDGWTTPVQLVVFSVAALMLFHVLFN
jgi:hypothetical protein